MNEKRKSREEAVGAAALREHGVDFFDFLDALLDPEDPKHDLAVEAAKSQEDQK